jgi:hypothetical protein
MDQAAKDRIQQELEDEAKKLFPGAVRRASLLQHGDDRLVEPGELVLRLVLIQPPGEHGEPPEPHTVLKPPAMKQFRHELSQRLPEVRRIEIMLEDAGGHPHKGHFMLRTADDEARPADGDLTPVMARLRPAELEIVDTLISAGIAANRAEAVRWALARISERPAYAQLREHTRTIERLKTEF